jgi:PAS domain S-box-containing protein
MQKTEKNDQSAQILLVDDNVDMLTAMACLLRLEGYEVIEATTGQEGLQLAKAKKPDVVLLDVVLPDMDGREVCRRIKEDPELADIYVALISGVKTASKDRIQGFDGGADGYLIRPIQNRELVAQVKAMVRIKKAEEALRKSEQRFQLVARATNDAVWDWNLETNTLWWNEGIKELFYYSLEEVKPDITWWYEHIHPEDRMRVISGIQKAIQESKRYWSDEYRYRRADGSYAYVFDRGYVILDHHGKPVRMVGSMMDITVRKQMETALRESEERFRATFEQAAVGIAHIAVDGRWLLVNQKLCEILGYTREELKEKTFQDITHPDDLAADLRYTHQVLANEIPTYSMEKRYLRKDGSQVWINLTMSLVRKPSGDPAYFIAVIEDITPRKQAEDQIRRLNEELEQRVLARTAELQATIKELEAFSYSVSHDLRAPLRAIHGFSRILLEDYAPQLSPEIQEYLHWISHNARQMSHLIDDLLAFARLSRQAIKKQPVATTALVHQVLTDLNEEQKGRHIEILIEDLPDCHADPVLLKQVFVNLLSNALKFTRRQEVARIKIGYQPGDPSGEQIYFVRDNGVGFNMQYADKLFGVFQRLHPAEEYEGTGVGLAIVRRIIHRHGGRVWAEGEVNKGATFYFTLPLWDSGT